jgi:hypothetical protein
MRDHGDSGAGFITDGVKGLLQLLAYLMNRLLSGKKWAPEAKGVKIPILGRKNFYVWNLLKDPLYHWLPPRERADSVDKQNHLLGTRRQPLFAAAFNLLL